MQEARIFDAGAFLASVYSRFASAYPTSAIGYNISIPPRFQWEQSTSHRPSKLSQHRVFLFCKNFEELNNTRATPDQFARGVKSLLINAKTSICEVSDGPNTDTSFALASFAASLEQAGYTTIWISLEEHHTVEGIVADLFDKMRLFDPELPTIILPSMRSLNHNSSDLHYSEAEESEEKNRRRKVLERLWDAMHRRRYLVCFDRFDSFGRPQTVHHGIPRTADELHLLQKNKRFCQLSAFLEELFGLQPPNGSEDDFTMASRVSRFDVRYAISMGIPRLRHVLQQANSHHGHMWHAASHSCRQLVALCASHDKSVRVFKGDELLSWHGQSRGKWQELMHQIVLSLKHLLPSERNPESMTPALGALIGTHSLLFNATLILGRLCRRTISGASKPESPEMRSRECEEAASAMLLVMALFRRPRSIIGVRSVIAQHVGRFIRLDARSIDGNSSPQRARIRAVFEWVTEQIEALRLRGLLWRFEGETIWIHGTAHEILYKACSEPARDSAIASLLSLQIPKPKKLASTFASLLSLSYWHRRIARYYYSSAFLPSKDMTAFWEYVYHRVSAIRYLSAAEGILWYACLSLGENEQVALLRAMAVLLQNIALDLPVDVDHALGEAAKEMNCLMFLPPINSDSFDNVASRSADNQNDIRRLWASALYGLGLLQPLYLKRLAAFTNPEPKEKLSPMAFLALLLHTNRSVQVQAIRRTFDRTRDQLLSRVTAETAIAWAQQLIDEDLAAIRGKRFLRDKNDPLTVAVRGLLGTGELSKDAHDIIYDKLPNLRSKFFDPDVARMRVGGAIRQFESVLRRLQGLATYQRRDYRECLLYIWDGLPSSHFRSLEGKRLEIFQGWQRLCRELQRSYLSDKQFPTSRDVRQIILDNQLFAKESFQKTSRSLWRFFETCFSKPALTTPPAMNSYAQEATVWCESLRRSSTCLYQIGCSAAAKLMLQFATKLAEDAFKCVTLNSEPKETREAERLLEQQHLSNIRRTIGAKLISIQPWCNFDALTCNRDISEEFVRDYRDAERLARDLEETARESPGASQGEYFEYRFEGLALRGRLRAIHGEYVEGHRLLDRAAAGLDQGGIRHRVLISKVHLYRAEALALSAGSTLLVAEDVEQAQDGSAKQRIRHAKEVLERADKELDSAERTLQGARREISAWIFVDLGKAQVGIQKLLLDLTAWPPHRMTAGWKFETYVANVERVVDRSLGALRRALDTIPYISVVPENDIEAPEHVPEHRVYAAWIQLMVVVDLALYQARFVEAQRRNRANIDYRRQIASDEKLSRVQDSKGFVSLWIEWSTMHRFEDFAKHLERAVSVDMSSPPASTSRNSNETEWLQFLQDWESGRRRILNSEIPSDPDHLPLLRERSLRSDSLVIMSDLAARWTRLLWNTRHPKGL